jgi:2',3'-cyclic-nucleotide 2'-phosphodiesterase (5'-nucleotidase family)
MQGSSKLSERPYRAFVLGLVALVTLMSTGASCGSASRETTPSVPEIAAVHLPRTDLRLLVLTDLMGYLEPCGCTSRPLGGIDRLAAALREHRSDGAPTLFVSAGDLFFDGTSHGVELAEASTQEVWKAETIADVLNGLGLAAAVPGPLDLRFGLPQFTAIRERSRFPLLGAGIRFPSAPATAEAQETPPLLGHVIENVGALRIGIVGVTQLEIAGTTLEDAQLMQLTREEVQAVRSEGAQLVIVLARASRRLVRRIADEIDSIDFVVQGGADDAEAHIPARGEKAVVLHASHHGQGLLVVDIARSEGTRFADVSAWTRTAERDHLVRDAEALRTRIAEWANDPNVAATDLEEQRRRLRDIEQRITHVAQTPSINSSAFDARFIELPEGARRDPEVTATLERYFRRVNDHNREAFANLLPRPAPEGRPSYVGAEACGTCHAEALSWWRTTMHGRAYRTLEDVHKEYNLSCVGCHVTGYGQPGGSTVSHVGVLQNVGCETCHGPGSMHIADPDTATVNVRRDAPEELCTGCHNREHSDRFHYPTYRRMMMAEGHGLPSATPTRTEP